MHLRSIYPAASGTAPGLKQRLQIEESSVKPVVVEEDRQPERRGASAGSGTAWGAVCCIYVTARNVFGDGNACGAYLLSELHDAGARLAAAQRNG